MGCCHFYQPEPGRDGAFTVDASRVTFGRGCLREVGERARSIGISRVALITDARVRALAIYDSVRRSLRDAGVDVALFDETRVEPTDESFLLAAKFAREANVDGYISLGGGSVIDTCKAANLYATHPADFLAYVNAPIGEGRAMPASLKPHIACPTTSGTGSEVTGIAICDVRSLHVKTGIANIALRPTEALVDPDATDTLPSEVVAASGMDVLSHALESYTARPYVKRAAPLRPQGRPMSQGANPWSDLGCKEALSVMGEYLARAVSDKADREARCEVMWAATLAGIAFGNAGVHAPHAMSYAVAGFVRDFRAKGYPNDAPIVPHGMAVIVNAPAAFRYMAASNPERHLEAARRLGADTRGAAPNDAGEVLATHLESLMRAVHMPNGISALGYNEGDVPALARGAAAQTRLLANAPREVNEHALLDLFRGAMSYATPNAD